MLNDGANPDRISQSAHSFRELMEKAPRYISRLPEERKQRTRYSLKPKVHELQDAWTKMQKTSNCFESDLDWSGEIDTPLNNFLEHLCQFFKEFQENRPTQRQEFAGLRQRRDPSTEALPENVEHLITEKWKNLYQKFVGICHHRYSSEPELELYIEQLEEMLILVLTPQTVSDHEMIKQQINILENND